jgi:hypothetical protein
MQFDELLAELDDLLEKVRQLRDKAAHAATAEPGSHLKADLFGVSGDLAKLNAKECCLRILKEHGNNPMNALTLAREALRRGYKGSAKGTDDDILMTTAKSFWARLCRDTRFEEIRPQVFVLVDGLLA